MVMLRAKREMTYMTRMLRPGDSFEATPVDARFLLGDESAEEDEAPQPRRGRAAPEEASTVYRRSAGKADEPEPEPVVVADEPPAVEEPSRDELLKMVAQRGIELPPGYVTKPELLRLLQGDGA